MEFGITFYVMLSAGLLIGIVQRFENFKYGMITLLVAVIAVAVATSVNPIPPTTSMIMIHVGVIMVPVILSGLVSCIQQRSPKKVSQ